MKQSELNQFIKEEVSKAMAEAVDTGAFRRLGVKESIITEAEAPLYKDWNEFVNPDYIMVHLKDGRKLQINKKNVAGGQRVYQAILQAFSDERTDITNKVVAAMASMLGGTLNKESMNEGAMSDINLMAQEAKSFNEFATKVFRAYKDSIDPMGKMEFYKWLQGIYTEVKSQTESNITESNTISLPKLSDIDHTRLIKWMTNQFDSKSWDLKKSSKGFEIAIDKLSKPEQDNLMNYLKSQNYITEAVITEATTKTILGVQFNVVPAQAGMKFEFKNVVQYRKSGIHVNQLVDEITKMLDSKFGKGLFTFMPAGRDQTDPKVNGLEFRMNASNFFKGL
jgi:hypothetical protein